MKARIFTTAVLMIVAIATYAQTSRREEREKRKNAQATENKVSENKTDNQKESRRSVRAAEQQSDANKTTENKPENTRQRENSNAQPAANNRSQNVNPGNSTESRRNQNENTNRTVNNNNNYQQGGDRRGDGRNSRVVVNENQSRVKREYVPINHAQRRVVVNHPRSYRPSPVSVRRVSHPYRVPFHREVIWSINLHNDFRIFYPEVRYWRYEEGYRIPAVAAYDAIDYVGDVARIYGKVFEVYYERGSDEYYLYFGDYYPYNDFSVIIPGSEARNISRRPERFFRRANITVTGYITEFDDKPEVLVRNARQIEVY